MREAREMRMGNKEADTRRKESRKRAFTNLMKKCVDELPGNGTFTAPGTPCPALAVGLGLGLGLGACIGSDLGAEEVLVFSVC